MRSLARCLQVSPNALYSHVENKPALIDEVLDDLLAEVEVPPPVPSRPPAAPADGLDVPHADRPP